MTVEGSILLIVGLVVLSSAVLAAFHSPNWLWLTGIMGALWFGHPLPASALLS